MSGKMSDFNRIGNMVLQDFKNIIGDHGFFIKDEFPDKGQIVIENRNGRIVLVNLLNLVEYYYSTQDDQAVYNFVSTIIGSLGTEKRLSWIEDQYNVFFSLYPLDAAIKPDLSRQITDYCSRFFILNMPGKSAWVSSLMLQEWGVGEVTLERQAHENANNLLRSTELIIEDIHGCPVGSFGNAEQGLNAALLLAPSLKEKVQTTFGWPLYAVIPHKNSCVFFHKKDWKRLEGFIENKVKHDYADLQRITPELLEINDWGVKAQFSLRKTT